MPVISLYYCTKKAVSHVINSRALTGEKLCINKAIHMLLMHSYATFKMFVLGPQISLVILSLFLPCTSSRSSAAGTTLGCHALLIICKFTTSRWSTRYSRWKLPFGTLGKIFSRLHTEILFLFSPENRIWHFVQCMKCQITFSGKNKKKYQFLIC